MWILESDGSSLEGKQRWLYPGGKFSFGRSTTNEACTFSIKNRTVSRHHLNIEVGLTTPDDAAMPNKRSHLILEDLKTKTGTIVNDRTIKSGTPCEYVSEKVLRIKIGRQEETFTISWKPCVFCFTPTKKEMKENFLGKMCARLAPLDIKVEANYRPGITHVVNTKRNTSKGLQALINGGYIVTPNFVDAVVRAANTDNTPPMYPLHDDFMLNWPDALNFLPKRGNETTDKMDEAYAPNVSRANVFEGYTFIFYNTNQYENLLGPITGGKGKALYKPVEANKTIVDDFVGFAKNAAGEKGLGTFDDGSEGKGVVVVRFLPPQDPDSKVFEWFEMFARQVSLSLDLRLVDQKEFLDAILSADASVLRKPLELESSSMFPRSTTASEQMAQARSLEVPASSAAINVDQERYGNSLQESLAIQSSEVPVSSIRRIPRTRRTAVKRFKGFDDFDDDDELPAQVPVGTQDAMQSMSSTRPPRSDDVSSQLAPSFQATQASQFHNGRRPASDISFEADPGLLPDVPDIDIVSQLAPAATSFKKRKLEEALQRGESAPEATGFTSTQAEDDGGPKKKKKKQREEIDILEHARIQREKAEEEAREQTQRLEQSLDGININDIRNLAVIEEMPVLRRGERMVHDKDGQAAADTNGEGTPSQRWNDAWNGRKNFKRFRRQGDDHGNGNRRIHKVIVQLEEVKKKDFGIGDDYWLEDGGDSSQLAGKSQVRSQRSEHKSQSQTQAAAYTKRIGKSSRVAAVQAQSTDDTPQTQDNQLNLEMEDLDDEMPELAQIKATSSTSQKRAAPEAIALPQSKKAKTAIASSSSKPTRAVTVDIDSDDNTGTFKFGRRRR